MKVAIGVVRFLLELCMLAAFAVWGATVNVAVAIAAPVAAIVVWGIWMAPKSDRRLAERQRLPLEIVLFGLATAALAAADHAAAAIAFGVVAAVDTALVHAVGE
jgi:Protein of unknown function (DUF2568)